MDSHIRLVGALPLSLLIVSANNLRKSINWKLHASKNNYGINPSNMNVGLADDTTCTNPFTEKCKKG